MAGSLGLFDLIDEIYDRQEQVELAIWRAHHARAVTAASPLALDLIAHLGFDPDALVVGLRPRAEWRRWICGAAAPVAGVFSRWSVGAAHARSEDAHEIDAFLHGGLVVREWGDPLGALGIRLSPAGLEVGARLGPVHLCTIGGIATLTTGLAIPETVRAASPGLAIERLFDHVVLRGRGYVVRRQYDRAPTADDPREAWRVEFQADPIPWRVPWRRMRLRSWWTSAA